MKRRGPPSHPPAARAKRPPARRAPSSGEEEEEWSEEEEKPGRKSGRGHGGGRRPRRASVKTTKYSMYPLITTQCCSGAAVNVKTIFSSIEIAIIKLRQSFNYYLFKRIPILIK